MSKIFTYFLFFLSFWAVSQKNSVEVQYEDKDFIFLDSAYVDLLRDIHAELILQYEDCLFLETRSPTPYYRESQWVFYGQNQKIISPY